VDRLLTMDRQLRKIATATRAEMESFARKHTGVGFKGSDIDLSCYCAIASYFLVMMGRKFGYNLSLVEGAAFDGSGDEFEYSNDEFADYDINHCWVEHKGKIIDLSAKQFDPSLKKVHIVDVDDNEYCPINRNNAVRKDFKANWPNEQSPYTYIKELRERANTLSIKIAA